MKMRSWLPLKTRRAEQNGQSIVEAVVVLALVAILVISVLRGVSQQATTRLRLANDALVEQATAGAAGGGDGGASSGSGGAGAQPGDDGSGGDAGSTASSGSGGIG